MTTSPPTPRQQDVLAAIRACQSERGVSPTYEEIGAALGISKITVREMVQGLCRRGIVRVRPKIARGIEILPDVTRRQVRDEIARRLRDLGYVHPAAIVADMDL